MALAPLPVAAQGASFNLQQAAARKGLMFGAAMEPQALEGDGPYAALVEAQCADITPENVMKWLALRPTRDSFDFSGADRLAAWASPPSWPCFRRASEGSAPGSIRRWPGALTRSM